MDDGSNLEKAQSMIEEREATGAGSLDGDYNEDGVQTSKRATEVSLGGGLKVEMSDIFFIIEKCHLHYFQHIFNHSLILLTHLLTILLVSMVTEVSLEEA